MTTLTPEDHKKRHKFLHKSLDELVADFIKHTGGLPSRLLISQLMAWSHTQTIKPDGEKI